MNKKQKINEWLYEKLHAVEVSAIIHTVKWHILTLMAQSCLPMKEDCVLGSSVTQRAVAPCPYELSLSSVGHLGGAGLTFEKVGSSG